MNHRNGYNHQLVDVGQAGRHHKLNHRNHQSSKPQERHHIRNREQEQEQEQEQHRHIRICEILVDLANHLFGNRNLELQQEHRHSHNQQQELGLGLAREHIHNQQQALVQHRHIHNCEILVDQANHLFGNRNLELQQEHRHNHNQQQGLAQLHNRKQVLQQQEQAFRKKRHNRLVLDQPSFVATL